MRSISVVVGGALGALARWGVGEVVPGDPDGFPLATLLVNVTGAFLIGVGGVWLIDRLPGAVHLRNLVLIGFLGAYTTFSAMALEGVLLIESGDVAVAMGYWLATLVLGMSAAVGGIWLGRVGA